MINTRFMSRYCNKCKGNINNTWQGGNCPNCSASLNKWGVKVEFVVKCPICKNVITSNELSCDQCGHQLPGTTLEHEQ